MSSKEQTCNRTDSKQRPPKPDSDNLDPLAEQQSHPATLIQRASLDPRSLAPSDVLRLQRAIGNQAVGLLLAQTAKHQSIQKKESKIDLSDNLKARQEMATQALRQSDSNAILQSDTPSRTSPLAPIQLAKPKKSASSKIDRGEKPEKITRWQTQGGRKKYRKSREAITNAVRKLKNKKMDKLVKRMNILFVSPRTYEELWIKGAGPIVTKIYEALYTGINKTEAARFAGELTGELPRFAKLVEAPRPGQAQQIAGTSSDGTYGGKKYHEGTQTDPIPIIFYKRNEHYQDIPHKKSTVPAISKSSPSPYSPLGINSKNVIFPYVGMVLQDMRRSLSRTENTRVRQLLVKNNYDLSGMEIDHIHDMGFGGQDSIDNLWPLAKEVNQRPHSGLWRSRYLFHYWDKAKGQIKKASINSPGMEGKYYKVKGFTGMEGNNLNALPDEHDRPDAGTD